MSDKRRVGHSFWYVELVTQFSTTGSTDVLCSCCSMLLMCHFPHRPGPHPNVRLTYMYKPPHSYAMKGCISKILWIICRIEIIDKQPHSEERKIHFSKAKGEVYRVHLKSLAHPHECRLWAAHLGARSHSTNWLSDSLLAFISELE